MADVADRLRALADAATPGPWESRRWAGEEWPDRRVSVGTKTGHGAAVCISPRYGDDEQVQHDARLIALTPELAVVCADALDALERHGYGPGLCRCEECAALADAARLLGKDTT